MSIGSYVVVGLAQAVPLPASPHRGTAAVLDSGLQVDLGSYVVVVLTEEVQPYLHGAPRLTVI